MGSPHTLPWSADFGSQPLLRFLDIVALFFYGGYRGFGGFGDVFIPMTSPVSDLSALVLLLFYRDLQFG